MLRNVRLTNFKCFEALELPCAPVTLLCGLNGMGKSSVIQALLMLRHSVREAWYTVPTELILRSEHMDLGAASDILFEDAQSSTVGIEVEDTEISKPYSLYFDVERMSDRLLTDEKSETYRWGAESGWNMTPPIGGNLIYVNAERIGPRKLYPLTETANRHGDMGVRGEFALAHWISRKGYVFSEDDPRVNGRRTRTAAAILEYWLNAISPGVHLHLETIDDADAILARFSFDRLGDVETRPYRASNVGFGLSYTLPVLIALLSSSGTLCLIENPEAHLHPRGQAKLAELAVLASKAGVQVIVETHSDHFMDGVRIAVRDRIVDPEEVAFHYFERKGTRSAVLSPKVDEDGRLSEWPSGFFDQHEENLARLLAPRS